MTTLMHALGRAGDRLRHRLGDGAFRIWFGSAWIENNSGAVVRVAVPSSFVRDWLRDRYGDVILDSFRRENPGCERVEIVVRRPKG